MDLSVEEFNIRIILLASELSWIVRLIHFRSVKQVLGKGELSACDGSLAQKVVAMCRVK